MTREGTRPFAALIAATLAAALLAACGSSDSDSSGSTEATGAVSTETSGSAASDDGTSSPAGRDGGQDQAGDDQSQSQGSGSGGAGSQSVETPLEVSGGGAEQFRSKGGDNSIQEYGEEGDESELREAAEIVHGFYVARAEEKWDTACSYLAKANIEQLEKLAAQSAQFKDSGCAPILEAFTSPLPAAVQREITTVDAGSFRREGEQGFLIYFGPGRTVYAMPLRDEGGSWKVAALSGTTLG